MSYITTYQPRNHMQICGHEYYPQKIAHTAIEHQRFADENVILRERVAQHDAVEKLRLAQLERADMIQTTQRMRIDELSKLNTEYCSEIERLEEVVAKTSAAIEVAMKTEDKKEILLRDYFAAKAMQSFAGFSDGFTGHGDQIGLLTRHAYLWADGMLKARDEARQ